MSVKFILLMAADLKAFLLNCFIGGEAFTLQPEGKYVRNKIELAFGGHDLTIIQKPWVVTVTGLSEYRDRTIDTTTIVVRNVQAEQREQILTLLEGLSYLLSFATGSEVAVRGYEHQGSKPRWENWAVVARTGHFRPPFDIHDGKAIKAYLESVWQEYFRLEKPRKLRVVIHLLGLSEISHSPLELKLATLFILLENLKSTYADEQGYPFQGGCYRKPSGKAWTFADLLSEIFGKVGMHPNLTAIKDLRNEIIHSGISQTPYNHQEEIYETCQDLILTFGHEIRHRRGAGTTASSIASILPPK